MARIIFVLLLWPVIAPSAEIYRCIDSEGGVSYQQTACRNEGERIETGDAQTAWASLRKDERKLYQNYRKRDQKRLESRREAARKQVAKRSGAEPVQCYNERHALEEVQAKLRAGYKASEGDRLRRQRDYLEGYLRKFCR